MFGRYGLISLIAGLAFCALYWAMFVDRAYIEVSLTNHGPSNTYFKAYWPDKQGRFHGSKSIRLPIRPGLNKVSSYLVDLEGLDRIRIDPVDYHGNFELHSVSIKQSGFAPIILKPADMPVSMIPSPHPPVTQELRTNGWYVEPVDHDFQLILEPDLKPAGGNTVRNVSTFAVILLAVFAISFLSRGLWRNNRWIIVATLMLLVAVTLMATVSRVDTHPDEKTHLQAVTYFTDHFLPPALDDPDIAHSYSIYGYTRLANFEIYYQLAGWFSALLTDVQLPAYLRARTVNCLFLLGLLLFAIYRPGFREFLIPLLLTAQAWYLFSYVNSDAIGIFVGLLVAYQAAHRSSLLNTSLQGTATKSTWIGLVAISLLIGTLLLVKPNHYFFVLFLGLYLLIRLGQGDFPDRSAFWPRIVLVGVIAAVPYGNRVAMDMAVNGIDRGERAELYEQMHEKHAADFFKPSTPLEKKHPYLYLRERGADIQRMIDREFWPQKSFQSAFGDYGYTQYRAVPAFFSSVENLGLALIALIVLTVLFRGPPAHHALLLATVVSVVSLYAILFWYSWSISFQPQGRYFAAMLPMFAVVFYEIRQYVNRIAITSLVIGLFALSYYSFVFIGLDQIGKIAHGYGPFQ